MRCQRVREKERETYRKKDRERGLRVKTFAIPLTNLKPEESPGRDKTDILIPIARRRNPQKHIQTQRPKLPEVICGDVIQLK